MPSNHVLPFLVAYCNETAPASNPNYRPVTPVKLEVGQELNYTCLSGRRFDVPSPPTHVTVRCEDNGNLTVPTFPPCVDVRCNLPPLLVGAHDMAYLNPPATPMRPGESVW